MAFPDAPVPCSPLVGRAGPDLRHEVWSRKGGLCGFAIIASRAKAVTSRRDRLSQRALAMVIQRSRLTLTFVRHTIAIVSRRLR